MEIDSYQHADADSAADSGAGSTGIEAPGGEPTAERVVDAFRSRFGDEPRCLVRAPGRVNLLGAHIDYSEGWVLPGAIDRAVWLAARPTANAPVSKIVALDFPGDAGRGRHTNREAPKKTAGDAGQELDATNLPPPLPEREDRTASWIDYPRGVAWALSQAGRAVPAIEAVFAGDVPIGSGVSSSAAVEVAFALAWSAAAGEDLDGLDRADPRQRRHRRHRRHRLATARIGQAAENGYLGVGSGIADQYASVHGEAGRLLFLDCRTLEHETVPFPQSAVILVADSGVSRELAGSGYNDRPRECAEALAILRRRLPHLRTLRDLEPDELKNCGRDLAEPLFRRARHVVDECRRVRAGAEALAAGDLDTFGALMRASHESSRYLYEVSTPELDLLARSASDADGCYGARLSGGGFGGCVTALVEESALEAVREAVGSAFEGEFGRKPPTFSCRIADGAGLISPQDE